MASKTIGDNSRIRTDERVPRSNMKPVRPLRGRFTHSRVSELLTAIHGEEEYKKMQDSGVDKRMMFGTNPHYQALVVGEELRDIEGNVLVPKMPPSKSIGALILPRLEETFSLEGAKDPSNQMNYTPDDDEVYGKILHKYDEIVLAYASPVCSAHCRYCYRLDLFNKDTGKMGCSPEELRDYIVNYNTKLKENGDIDPETGDRRYPIREVLLSGGDPMVLTNAMIYRFLVAAGEAGVSILRIGSKEWAFRPERFDEQFAETLKIVHEKYPHMHINFVSHISHPDEFLLRDDDGNYIPNDGGAGYKWMDISREAVQRMLRLGFTTIENQTPIISKVNDDAEALRILHEEIRRMGIKPKYLFQGRDIEGHKAFSVPVEQAWKIHNDAMKGLSDTCRSRFAMSTEWGKMEVMSVIDPIALPEDRSALPGRLFHVLDEVLADGLIVFKAHRSPHEAESQGDLIIAKRNPEALWISGYEDRIIYDSRAQKDDKYDGLIEMLLMAMSSNVFEKFLVGKDGEHIGLGAANDPDKEKEAKKAEEAREKVTA